MRLVALLCSMFCASLSFAQNQPGWQLIWSDEFDGPFNTPPDAVRWGYDLGATGWGNNELENYTSARENAYLDGEGHLIITARRTGTGGYSSARLKTQGKFTVLYGKVEARIKIPFGQGIWPAFWMLGSDIDTVHWPACGEIDVMENIGREPSTVHGSAHGPGYSGGNPITAAYSLPGGQKFADDFHTFAVIWTPESIEFLVDAVPYLKTTPATLPAGTEWVYRKPFFLLLNLAVGGNWPGNPDSTTQLPQQMIVDHVRVYRRAGVHH